ncbi:MAG: sugar nucleotide-binding protein [Planctomycetaceae bacterium]|nr:sugar nucleotide-binding protein [Planctomycetaceae bacterium]MCA9110933.1 sugar nucleotide-binding protein [Planctomycetaceae bacterium]
MKRLLIVGAETVVGANLATEASDRYQVVALTHEPRVSILGCEMLTAGKDGPSPQEWLEDLQPDAVVLCGPASRSAWDSATETVIDEQMVLSAGEWAAASRSQECHFTFISSDAVFSGPWMFHDEDSQAFCPSPGARLILRAEKMAAEQCPQGLIIRTNAFGWSPAGGSVGWIDQILADLDRRSLQNYDFLRHGTPILATDLADILLRAIDENLTGLHHVGSAERVNPLQFAQRLADHFELPWLSVRRAEESLDEPVVGFGAGETSLQTKKIRKALCVAMPMLSEGLSRLRAQQQDGYCDQFGPDHPVAVRQSA